MIRLALLLASALVAADVPVTVPPREQAARTFACPPGAELLGAPPPLGFETWCELPGEPPATRRHGPALTWYDDGGLAKASAFDHGRLEGLFLEWHRNGKPARAGRYHAGEREGRWTLWFESGLREEECGYAHDLQHGPFAAWWPNGRRRSEGRFCRGLQCGTWTTWDDAGRELGRMTYEEIRGTP